MAEKRYWWLKLPSDFFNQKEIKHIRRAEKGDTYTVIYLKMLLASLQNNGILTFDGIEETFIEELAFLLDEQEENVKYTVELLKKMNLLVELSETQNLLPFVREYVGSESASAGRMRKKRQKDNELSPCDGVPSQIYDDVTIKRSNVTNIHNNVTDSCHSVTERRDREEIGTTQKKTSGQSASASGAGTPERPQSEKSIYERMRE